MPKKLTNSIFDQYIINSDVIRIDDYITSHVKIKFKCKKCEYVWETDPHSLLKKTRKQEPLCRMCYPDLVKGGTLSNQIIDYRFKLKNMKRLGDYVKAARKIKAQCLVCGYMWMAVYTDNKHGCPKCAKCAKLSLEELENRLKPRNIQLLDEYTNTAKKVSFKCLKCENIWRTRLNSILSGRGCPKCSDIKLSNKIIDERLNGRGIIRIEEYKTALTKINFKCLNCSNVWAATPNEITTKLNGCPLCSASKCEKFIYKLLTDNQIKFDYHFRLKSLNKDNPKLIVDFYIVSKNIIIEYNGGQHYRPVRFHGMKKEIAEMNFKKQLIRDSILERFCLDNGIKLIWINGDKYRGSKLIDYVLNTVIPQLV